MRSGQRLAVRERNGLQWITLRRGGVGQATARLPLNTTLANFETYDAEQYCGYLLGFHIFWYLRQDLVQLSTAQQTESSLHA